MKIRAVYPFLVAIAILTGIVFADTTPSQPASQSKSKKKKKRSTARSSAAKPGVSAVKHPPKPLVGKVVAQSTSTHFVGTVVRPRVRRRRPVSSAWDEPTYADSTAGDNVDGEDIDVRRAAVESLGPLNGSVVVSDPNTGRILAMVNQKLALSDGYQPCSTVKVPVAFAALSEGLVDRTTMVRIYGRTKLNLTQALAKSNNQYFAKLGEQLGYEKFSYYAHLFGLGEKAGLDIPGEHAGHFPAEPPKNGGTLYYLQHPRSQEEIANFVPRIKRRLEIENQIAEVEPGMRGAVQYGTARRIQALTEDNIMGKTGTCSDRRTHLGWFGSFSEINGKKVAVAVLLTGGKPCVGPAAAGVAGGVYKRLSEQHFFEAKTAMTPAAFVSQSNILHPASGY